MRKFVFPTAAEARLTTTTVLLVDSYFFDSDEKPSGIFKKSIEQVERALLNRVLFLCGGSYEHASQALGITQTELAEKVREHDL